MNVTDENCEIIGGILDSCDFLELVNGSICD